MKETLLDEDNPTLVLKEKRNTSLVKSIELLKKDDETIGLISAGPTGGLLISSIFHLGLLKGLKTPMCRKRCDFFREQNHPLIEQKLPTSGSSRSGKEMNCFIGQALGGRAANAAQPLYLSNIFYSTFPYLYLNNQA